MTITPSALSRVESFTLLIVPSVFVATAPFTISCTTGRSVSMRVIFHFRDFFLLTVSTTSPLMSSKSSESDSRLSTKPSLPRSPREAKAVPSALGCISRVGTAVPFSAKKTMPPFGLLNTDTRPGSMAGNVMFPPSIRRWLCCMWIRSARGPMRSPGNGRTCC